MVAISYIRSLKFDIPPDYSYYRIWKGKTKYEETDIISTCGCDNGWMSFGQRVK